MTSNQRNWATILATVVVSDLAIAAYLFYAGVSDDSLRVLLRVGTRVAFAVFLFIFIARPLHDLVKTDLTRGLLRNRRQLGLTFGTLMLSHLSLIIWRFAPNPDINLDSGAFVGASAYGLILLLMITSFDAPARLLGPRKWKVLHKIGLYLIFGVFAVTFLPQSREQLFEPSHIGFTVLIVAAAFIRMMAFFAGLKKR